MMGNAQSGGLFFLFRLLYAGIFLCAVFLNLSAFLGIPHVTWAHLSVLVIVLMAALLFRSIKRRIRLQMAGGFGGMLLLFVALGGVSKWRPFIKNVWELPMGLGNISALERLYAEYTWVVLIALTGYFFYLGMEKYFVLKVVAAAMLVFSLLWRLFGNGQGSKAGTAFTMLFTLLVLGDWVRLKWEKVKGENAYGFMLGIMPFFAAYFCILLMLPVIEKPYDWQWAKDLYEKTGERLTGYTENLFHTGQEDMDLAMSGFSEKGSLIGGIQSEERKLMKIETGYNMGSPLYLTGRVFDSFDGRNWQSKGSEEADWRLFDVLETSYGLSGYAEHDKWRYLKNGSLEMTYQYFHTNYLLAPSKVWEIRGENPGYYREGENLLFNRNAGFGTHYFFDYCQLSMSREEVLEFLEWKGEESEETWKRVVRQYTKENIGMEELYAYRERMKERYAKEADVSPRVQDWILQNTAGAVSDVEKLQKIEEALSMMEYSRNPGALPDQVVDERSFLDFFLSESQKGYCTYYATAFVLLARAEGFPARYVQGFRVPAGKGKEISVYSDMAHAWPEVYMEGKGWIPFEPTPGYGRYDSAAQGVKKGEGAKGQGVIGQNGEKVQEEPVTELSGEAESIPEEEQAVKRKIGRCVVILCCVLLFAFLACVLLLTIDYLWRRKRAKKWDLRKQYQAAVLYNFQILEMLGLKRKETETWQEMMERIGGTCDGTGKMPIGFITTYEHVIYGALTVDEDILYKALKEKEQLLILLKQKKGKAYWWYRIKLDGRYRESL